MPVKFWHTIARFWIFLSYLITTVNKTKIKRDKKKLKLIWLVFDFEKGSNQNFVKIVYLSLNPKLKFKFWKAFSI